jgi:competence protein ComEC
MHNRPLIPMLMAFAGGILFGHTTLAPFKWLILPLFLAITFCLFTTLFLSYRLRILSLLFAFFITGTLLDLAMHRPSQLTVLAAQRKNVTIDGTVLKPAKNIDEMARFLVRGHGVQVEGRHILVNEDLLVSVYNHATHFRPGQRIRFPARLRPFKNFNNPGRYDHESAMELQGLSCAASVSDGRHIVPMGPGYLPFPRALLERLQSPVRDFFTRKLDPQDRALFRALILGERQDITHELREPFNNTGLGHVLAVSGLHIGLVAGIAFFLFKGTLSRSYRLALDTDIQKLAAFLTCIPVVGYTCLAGFHVTTQRAMIMVLVFLWSLILQREREVWSTLALAGLLILAIDPHALFSIPFQLSFSAVIGILLLTPPLLNRALPSQKPHRHKRTITHRLLVYIVGLIVVSLSATVFLIPIISFYFHRISLVSIPANITVVPILGLWVIPLGLLSAVTLPVSSEAANLFLQLGVMGLHAMMEMIRFCSSLPWSSFWVTRPNLFEMSMFYMLILLLLFLKRWSWAKTGIILLAILVLGDISYWTYRTRFNKNLKVTFLDVGQGNAALVLFPGGKKMLIDGGGFARDYFDVGKMVVAPYLWHSKIWSIDYLVLSHPDADHMNGLRFIARAFRPKELWHNGDKVEKGPYEELMTIAESQRIRKILPTDLTSGRQINGVTVEVLHPHPGAPPLDLYDSKNRLNNNSLVLKISYLGTSFLFPGDLEQQGTEVLISNAGASLKSDILLSPHHGSNSANPEEFLQVVWPRICVISSGEISPYGSHHHQTLKRLEDIGCKVFRVSRVGAIQFTVRPDHLDIKTFLCNGSAL